MAPPSRPPAPARRRILATKCARMRTSAPQLACKAARLPTIQVRRNRAPTPDPSRRRRRRNTQRAGRTPPHAPAISLTAALAQAIESSSDGEGDDGDEGEGEPGAEEREGNTSAEDSSYSDENDSGEEVGSDESESEQEIAEYSPAELDDDEVESHAPPSAQNSSEVNSQPPSKRIKLEEGGSGAGSSGGEQSLYFSPANAKLKDQLECSICLELFRDPKMLDCGHTYCWGCIQRMLSTQPGPSNRARKISCPQCRQSISVPAKGLKTNQLIKSMVYKLKEEAMTEPCKLEDAGQLERMVCTQCGEATDRRKLFICVDASHAEQKQSSSTSPISDEYWNAEEVLCAVCILSSHRNHSTHPLTEIVSAEDRNTVILKLDSIRDVVESKLNSLLDIHLQEFNQFSQSRLCGVSALMSEVLDFDRMRFKTSLDECLRKAEQIEASLNRVHFNLDAPQRAERVRALVGLLVDGEAGSDRRSVSKSTSTDTPTGASFVEWAKSIRRRVENVCATSTATDNDGNNDSVGEGSAAVPQPSASSATTSGVTQNCGTSRRITQKSRNLPLRSIATAGMRAAMKKTRPPTCCSLPAPSVTLKAAPAANALPSTTSLGWGLEAESPDTWALLGGRFGYSGASGGQSAPLSNNNSQPHSSASSSLPQQTNPTSAIKREPGGPDAHTIPATDSPQAASSSGAVPAIVAPPVHQQPSSSNAASQQPPVVGPRPKRPMSSFFWWMKENRQRIAQMENMKSGQDVAKQCGIEWAAIAPKDRERWERMAREDKQRYAKDVCKQRK